FGKSPGARLGGGNDCETEDRRQHGRGCRARDDLANGRILRRRKRRAVAAGWQPIPRLAVHGRWSAGPVGGACRWERQRLDFILSNLTVGLPSCAARVPRMVRLALKPTTKFGRRAAMSAAVFNNRPI